MSDIILSSNGIEPLPLPQVDVTIRPGVLSDVPFMDSLQKLHAKQVGWMPRGQLEEKIRLGQVLVAVSSTQKAVGSEEQLRTDPGEGVSCPSDLRTAYCVLPTPVGSEEAEASPSSPLLRTADCVLPTPLGVAVSSTQKAVGREEQVRTDPGEGVSCPSDLRTAYCVLPTPTPVGYVIASDQYFKRDDVGIIYQMNVVPGRQRGLVGASLLKAQFERSAYGCKLYCCWCAQDIEANRFWEAMGFVPLAFRAGSEKRSRVHIFWQKRIRSGDVTTPWWFPSKTSGGSIREDRIVLPIPPGTHWSDAKPLIFPAGGETQLPEPKRAAAEKAKKAVEVKTGAVKAVEVKTGAVKAAVKTGAEKTKKVETPPPLRRNGLMFDIPQQGEPLPEDKPAKPLTAAKAAAKAAVKAAAKIEPKSRRVCDPRLVAAARELRDRWLEQVNATPLVARGKYEVTRVIDDQLRVSVVEPTSGKLLAA